MITSKKIAFEPVESKDLHKIQTLINNFSNVEDSLSKPFILKNFKEVENKYLLNSVDNPTTINYVITSAISNLIGVISFIVVAKDKKTTLEIILDKESPQYMDKFKNVLTLALDYSFNGLNLNKVKISINSKNKELKKLIEDMNFKLEATSREDVFLNGEYLDTLNFGIIKPLS